MDGAIGVPVVKAITGDERVTASVLPAGPSAALVYTGDAHGIPANRALRA